MIKPNKYLMIFLAYTVLYVVYLNRHEASLSVIICGLLYGIAGYLYGGNAELLNVENNLRIQSENNLEP